MEWHGAVAIYVIGTLALIISAVHTAVTSQEKGTLMNGFELEKNLDLRRVFFLFFMLKLILIFRNRQKRKGKWQNCAEKQTD